MQPHAEQRFDLLDAQQRLLGRVGVERTEGELVLGTFSAGPAFPAVEHIFHDFEEAANAQALAVVEECDAAIAALGLHLQSPDGSQGIAIHDVQIWSDGGMSCRLGPRAPLPANGTGGAAQTANPTPAPGSVSGK